MLKTRSCERCGISFSRKRTPGASNWPRFCSYTCARLADKVLRRGMPPPTAHPTLNDLHWAAGVYEGEGTCQRPRGKGASVYVHVTQKDPDILVRLVTLFGGRVHGPTKTNGRFYLHRWQLCGARAHGFLLSVFSMLSPWRRDQVRRALGRPAVDRPADAPALFSRPALADIHWAAGIYEGEGSCQNVGGSPVVHVNQKDPFILHRLREFFGGTVRQRASVRLLTGREIHRWILSGRRARGFLLTMFTMLSQRRRAQVRLALAPKGG
jgi:hypothetical protein